MKKIEPIMFTIMLILGISIGWTIQTVPSSGHPGDEMLVNPLAQWLTKILLLFIFWISWGCTIDTLWNLKVTRKWLNAPPELGEQVVHTEIGIDNVNTIVKGTLHSIEIGKDDIMWGRVNGIYIRADNATGEVYSQNPCKHVLLPFDELKLL
jgi:hypothetical protein